jgi:hypothetical protein
LARVVSVIIFSLKSIIAETDAVKAQVGDLARAQRRAPPIVMALPDRVLQGIAQGLEGAPFVGVVAHENKATLPIFLTVHEV